MVRASDDELLDRHGRWYIARRDPRHLKRNALIALGNVGDPNDELVLRTVRETVDSPDELLAEHAAWAMRRLDERRAALV